MDLNQDQFIATEGKYQTVGIPASLISLVRDREEKKAHWTCLPCNEPPVLDQQSKISSTVGVIMKKQKNEI